jgi:hypothetical protein
MRAAINNAPDMIEPDDFAARVATIDWAKIAAALDERG